MTTMLMMMMMTMMITMMMTMVMACMKLWIRVGIMGCCKDETSIGYDDNDDDDDDGMYEAVDGVGIMMY